MKNSQILLANQARSYAGATHHLIRLVFETRKPADRLLAAFVRGQKRYGSTDRRTIGDTLFSVFRWWGWLRQLPGIEESIARETPAEPLADRAWCRLLLAAHLLDNAEAAPVAIRWKDAAGITPFVDGWTQRDLPAKAAAFAELFHVPAPTWRDLVPDWIYPHIPLSGAPLADLVGCLQRRPPLWLRSQDDPAEVERALRHAGLHPERSSHLPGAICVRDARVNLYELEPFRQGRFEVQDFASQVIGATCAASPGQRWWDACAGAGGKSLQLARQMQSKGTLLATDIRGYKLDDLKLRARRAQLSNIRTKAWDGKHMPGKHLDFDGVLVDAPCSNTGTWRRNPDARWSLTPGDIEEMPRIQADLLDRVARAVKPGGALLYATCSLCRAENEDVVTGFLAGHPEFAPADIAHPVTGDTHRGMLRIWPAEADSDAMFVARMIRQG